MRLNVFHYPIQGWIDSVVLNFLMGRASVIQIDELAGCSYQPFADAMTQILPVEQRHAELGEAGLRKAMAAGHDPTDAQASVNYWYRRVADTFGRGSFRPLRHLPPLRPAPAPQPGAARALAGQRRADPGRARPRGAALGAAMRLKSYAAGRWVAGTGRPAVLASAITGEPVAEIDSTGLDFAAMLDHARTVGGPALRELTFHQRALMLKALAGYLMERKEEFYELSKPTGATRTDAWIDVEGGIGTLFAYASKGRRELPNATFHLDGAPEPLAKGGTLRRPAHLPCRWRVRPSTSTPSTSPAGACWRRSRPPCSPACPRSSSRPARPPTSPRRWSAGSSNPASCPRARCS